MTITLAWTSEDDALLREKHGTMSIVALANLLGRTRAAVRGRVTRIGIAKKVLWTAQEERELIDLYEKAGPTGVLRLNDFARRVGRHAGNVCTKARQLGLVTNQCRKTVEVRKDRNKYDTKEELRAAMSANAKARIAANGHPRGFAGRKHSEAALKLISAASKAQQLFITEDQKNARVLKAMKTKVERYGSVATRATGRGTWKAGWREIGGKRNYYRSRWEANYARYLQWLKEQGVIADWQHEPETFWFEQIKRGTRSYLPDFRVWELDGSTALHEVKGWMDQRSRTTLSRMKKYHPTQKIVLIDGAQYRAIRLKVMRLIEGWEDSKRDSHA
jgi:hypothetical protein